MIDWPFEYRNLPTHRYDFEHLLSGNEAVAIEVVHGEGPAQLLLEATSRRDTERADELPKVDVTVTIGVKSPEHVFSELGGVSVREKVAVDFLELLNRQHAVGTVFEEATVPLLQFCFTELGVRHEIRYHLRLQLRVLLTHAARRRKGFQLRRESFASNEADLETQRAILNFSDNCVCAM